MMVVIGVACMLVDVRGGVFRMMVVLPASIVMVGWMWCVAGKVVEGLI